MGDTPAARPDIIDTIMAIDIIMPALLDVLARQGPQQREEIQAILAHAIYRCAREDMKADMEGVADILSAWKDHITMHARPFDA